MSEKNTSCIVKTMSLSQSEFQRSIAHLHPPCSKLPPALSYDIREASGLVTIRYEPLSPQIHGGLLELPRARVTLTFHGLNEEQRARFKARFDLTFRRGGG